MTARADADPRRVRSRRPPKPTRDPWRAQGWHRESERRPDGSSVLDLTVFLTGRECPWACVFCDLWRYTTDTPTPAGAIRGQLRQALEDAGPLDGPAQLKLYNASNLFDRLAVPEADDESIARLAAPFERVVAESHPKLVGDRALRFADRIDGRLEVAMGLETVHPKAQPRLGKGANLDDYDRAIRLLHEHGIDWRAFVLVGAPFVPVEEDARWVAETVRFAVDRGARHVSLIPVRGGNGTLESLEERGEWVPPTLDSLENAAAAVDAITTRRETVVTVDLWDIESLGGGCDACRPTRIERLREVNARGHFAPAGCARCSLAPRPHEP